MFSCLNKKNTRLRFFEKFERLLKAVGRVELL
jgi:hypothetical protein